MIEERKKQNLTMRELAKLAGCTHTTIGEIEKSNRKMSLAIAEKITAALGLRLSEVFKKIEA